MMRQFLWFYHEVFVVYKTIRKDYVQGYKI